MNKYKVFTMTLVLLMSASGHARSKSQIRKSIRRDLAKQGISTNSHGTNTTLQDGMKVPSDSGDKESTAQDAMSIQGIDEKSISPNSGKAAKSLSAATIINGVTAGILIKECISSTNLSLCAMGVMAGMQALQDMKGSGEASGVYDASTNYDPHSDLYDPNNPSGTGRSNPPTGPATGPAVQSSPDSIAENGTGQFKTPEMESAIKALNEKGYFVSEKGMLAPNGTLVPGSQMGSASALASAGMSPSSIAEAQEVLGAINEELASLNQGKVSGVALDASGGGGGSYGGDEGGGGSSSDSSDYGLKNGNPFDLNSNQKDALVAGKSVMFDGEPIGVRGLNIFDMIHVAYQRKSTKNVFMDGTQMVAPAAKIRQPASALPSKTGASPRKR